MFHVSLLEQNITKKGRADKGLEIKLKVGDNIEYKMEAI